MLLELEIMLPKGSNSGLYFQGRYELQLKDSWVVKIPLGSDMGGFHNNWEKEEGKIFRGIPPTSNASKAPGLWQKYKVRFQAPRFNEVGDKISNAKFISIELNGVRIHSNVEVPTYTGGPIEKNEVAKRPLLIQGNHGPVAIRNFKYQLLKESTVSLSSLSQIVYQGSFKGLDEFNDRPKIVSGKVNEIDILSLGEDGYKVRIVTDNLRSFYVYEINLKGIKEKESGQLTLHPTFYYTLNNIAEGDKLELSQLSTKRSSKVKKKVTKKKTHVNRKVVIKKNPVLTDGQVQPLLINNTCVACHHKEKRLVGPSFKLIAKRNYTNEKIVELIYNPQPKNWPEYATPMAPMPQVPKAEALKIAAWINSLK